MESVKINNTTLNYNKVWYVDAVNGNDSTGNGSKEKPYVSVDKAIGVAGVSGDCIYLMPGTYKPSAQPKNNLSFIGLKNVEFMGSSNSAATWSNDLKKLYFYNIIFNQLTYMDFSATTFYYYNCVFKNPTRATQCLGSIFFTNCVFSGLYSLWFYNTTSDYGGIVAKNSVYEYEGTIYSGYVKQPSSLKTTTDASYYPTSGVWKNVGDSSIQDPDGKQSSIGVYGGPYAWGDWGGSDGNGTKLLILTAEGLKKYTTAWQSVAGDWSTMTDVQKKALFQSDGVDKLPTAQNLAELGKYKILRYTGDAAATAPKLKVTAIPLDRLFIPKKLIPITTLTHFKNAELTGSFSGQGAMHLLVTNDLLTYMTWDGTTFKNCIKVSQDGTTKQKWVSGAWVDTDYTGLAAYVKENGISPDSLKSIPQASWDTLIIGKAGYGFAYLPTIEASTDVCTNDKITVTVTKNGKYRQAVHPTEYDVEYDTQDHVILKQSGDWEILYIK